MSGFFFQGVREAPNGDLVPSFPISEDAHRRIRERWSTLQLIGPRGEPIVGQQREEYTGGGCPRNRAGKP